jgi:hypothetical protein
MKPGILERLRREFESARAFFGDSEELSHFWGKPVPEEEIAKAEETLGIILPEDYRRFIAEFGYGSAGTYYIFGLGTGGRDFVQDTLRIRECGILPEDLDDFVVISSDGWGNPIGFLPGNPTIWMPDHDCGVIWKLVPSFEALIEKLLDGKDLLEDDHEPSSHCRSRIHLL